LSQTLQANNDPLIAQLLVAVGILNKAVDEVNRAIDQVNRAIDASRHEHPPTAEETKEDDHG